MTEIRKVWPNGGCSAITIPAKFGVKVGEFLKLTQKGNKIIIERLGESG